MRRIGLGLLAMMALGSNPALAATSKVEAAGVKITVEDDAFEPEVILSTPHKVTWKSMAEAWLRGYLDTKTGVLTVQVLVSTNGGDRTQRPVAVNFLTSEGPVQRVVSEAPAPLGRCPVDETCRWAPNEQPPPLLPCRSIDCITQESFSVGWLVTTIPIDTVEAAAKTSAPWRYKVKRGNGIEQIGEIPQSFFAALVAIAEARKVRP